MPSSAFTCVAPKQAYCSATGGSPPKHHYRRPSLKRTLTPASPGVSAPRTHCPRDVDAFSFNPSHLPAWNAPQHLWDRLPDRLRPHITGVQHAGAAVLTGFERLRDIRTTLLTDLVELDEPQDEAAQAMLMRSATESGVRTENELDVLLSNMSFETTKRGPRSRHDSLATPALSTPSLTPPSSDDASDRSAGSSMPGTPGESTPVTPASPPTPISPFSFPADKTRTSPLPLSSPMASPLDPDTPCSPVNMPSTTNSVAVACALRPFTAPPRHPHAAYYAAELAELRCVALVRLRHAARRVDAEWGECKRVGVLHPSERENDALLAKEFERWWVEKKAAVSALEERVRRIERLGVGLGGVV